MNILLLIHNISFTLSALAGIAVAFFVFFNNKRSITNIMFALVFLTADVFIISHIIGVSVSDPVLSERILMFNLAMFFIGIFNVHAVLSFLNKASKRWNMLVLIYAAGLFLSLWFIIHPDLFLLPSIPKMYFPNYYNPGVFNWIRVAFLYGICVTYMLVELIIAYRASGGDTKRRNQLKYFIIAMIGGYAAGFVPNFLVYNIPIDPLWGMIFPVFAAIPIVYASLKYEFLDIKIIAKQAFLYTIGIGIVGGLIVLFDYSNRLMETAYPGFPFWITPLASSILVILVAGLVWRKLREGDILKYEFVTTVTHKFRTPLTHIKWASENLEKDVTPEEKREQLGYIKSANTKLVELTNLLTSTADIGAEAYQYKIARNDLSETVNEVAASSADHIKAKSLRLVTDIEPGIYAAFDQFRLKSVIQIMVDNAIGYTPLGGIVKISLRRTGRNTVCSITDTGIGMSKEDLPLIFSKFYRGKEARSTDTEGLGIGLYIAREIVNRHKGKMWAESDGANKGSTFSFSLPVAV